MTPPEFVDVYLLATGKDVGQACKMQFNEYVTHAAPNDKDAFGASFGEWVSINSLLCLCYSHLPRKLPTFPPPVSVREWKNKRLHFAVFNFVLDKVQKAF